MGEWIRQWVIAVAGLIGLAAPAPLPSQPPRLAYASVIEGPQSPAPAPAPAAAPAARRPTTIENIRITRELPVTRWLPPGEWLWDDAGAPAGRSIVVVNLRSRTLSVYRAGVEIGRSSILYGAPDAPTPTGTFPILQMRRDHTSNLFNAPMPHMMRLTWGGVALHGSPRLGDNLATNGCVGLPREFAARLYEVMRVGDEVVIWSGRAGA